MKPYKKCKGCSSSVRLKEDDIYEILQNVRNNSKDKQKEYVNKDTYKNRLTICIKCDDLLYETTCKYDGFLIYVKAKELKATCSKPGDKKW